MPTSSRGTPAYNGSRRGSGLRGSQPRSRGTSSTAGLSQRSSYQRRSRAGRHASSQRSRNTSGPRGGSRASQHLSRAVPSISSQDLSPPPQIVSSPPIITHQPAGFRYLDAEDVGASPSSNMLEMDAIDEIILAVDMRANGSMGCAYYLASTQDIYLLNDMQSAGMHVLGSLVVQVQPTTVLTSFQAPEAVIEYLEQDSKAIENVHPHYILRTMPSADFGPESAMKTLADLPILSSFPQSLRVRAGSLARDPVLDIHGKNSFSVAADTRLGACINLEAQISIGCAGALLKEVFCRRNAEQSRDKVGSRVVNSLQMFSLANTMLVTGDTLRSLQILNSELHPNRQIWGTGKSSSGAKESLSLCGLLHGFAITPQGRKRLRRMLLQPAIDIDVIRERQHMVALLLRPENGEVLKNICASLRKLSDLRKVLDLLQKGVESAGGRGAVDRGAWWTLTKFALNVLHLRDAVSQLSPPNASKLQRETVERVSIGVMKHLGEHINAIVDFEEAKSGSRIAVKWGLNEELDNLKREYIGLPELLSQISWAISREVPEWAAKYIDGCTFWPQLGFLTTVPVDPLSGDSLYDGQGLDEDPWQKQFIANNMVYYKNRRMLELDNCKGDMYGRILDAQVDIIHDLSVRVLEHRDALILASDAVGELDAITALALAAERYAWKAPRITTDNILHIRGGRHPLQELVVSSYVPNDCYLSGGKEDGGESSHDHAPDRPASPGSLLVLTGPNHSGKSVYIKKVALIVYLAHIGSFVPAEEAIVGLTDQILTRISTRECVTENESAFAIDLRQIAFCLKAATTRSLVLVDEFGKGTRADDGAGLMSALLSHFLSLAHDSPRVIAATHFHEIFEGQHLPEHAQLMFAHMDVHMNLAAGHKNQFMTYLYTLMPGRSSSSFGSLCASLNGVDAAVVDRAEAIALLLAKNEDLSAACARLGNEDQRQLEEAEAVARQYLSLSAEDLSRDVEVEGLLKAVLRGDRGI